MNATRYYGIAGVRRRSAATAAKPDAAADGSDSAVDGHPGGGTGHSVTIPRWSTPSATSRGLVHVDHAQRQRVRSSHRHRCDRWHVVVPVGPRRAGMGPRLRVRHGKPFLPGRQFDRPDLSFNSSPGPTRRSRPFRTGDESTATGLAPWAGSMTSRLCGRTPARLLLAPDPVATRWLRAASRSSTRASSGHSQSSLVDSAKGDTTVLFQLSTRSRAPTRTRRISRIGTRGPVTPRPTPSRRR